MHIKKASSTIFNAFFFAGLLAISESALAGNYSYSIISDPNGNGSNTHALGINNSGKVVGFSAVSATVVNNQATGMNGLLGFVYDGASYTSVIYPGSIEPTYASNAKYVQNIAADINDSGQIAGTFLVSSRGIAGYPGSVSSVYGFLFNSGNYTTILDPAAPSQSGSIQNFIVGLNNSGQIAGYYTNFNNGGIPESFLYSGGAYISINDPSATNGTEVSGINNIGEIVGQYWSTTLSGNPFMPVSQSFVYSQLSHTYTDIAPGIVATGINDNGLVIGNLGSDYGFGLVYDLNTSTYAFLNPPGSKAGGIYATDINDNGQVVGYYFNGTGYVGFIATPTTVPTVPIPATIWLFSSALAGLGIARKLRIFGSRAI